MTKTEIDYKRKEKGIRMEELFEGIYLLVISVILMLSVIL